MSPSSASTTLPDYIEGDRRDPVLEPHQFQDDVGRDHIGPRTEQLPELHERGPQLFQHLADVLAALLQHGLCPAAVGGDKVPEVVTLEEVPEAVPDRYLGDLPDPLEVAEAGHEPGETDGRHDGTPTPQVPLQILRYAGGGVQLPLGQAEPVLYLTNAEVKILEITVRGEAHVAIGALQ